MSDKQRFSFLLRLDERADLQRLAEDAHRSQGAVLRLLIRQAIRNVRQLTNASTTTMTTTRKKSDVERHSDDMTIGGR